MKNNQKEALIREYEDAALALILNDYAEQEGNRLLAEFEAAKARGDVPAVPEELDQKCRDLIRRTYKQNERQARTRKMLSTAGKVAAAWCITLGICATLVLSAEALRIPVMNYILDQYEDFMIVLTSSEPATTEDHLTPNTYPLLTGDTPLAGILTAEYQVVHYNSHDDGTFVVSYESANGSRIILNSYQEQGTLRVDSEDATIIEIQICGHHGQLIEQSDKVTILWVDEDVGFIYHLSVTNCDIGFVWQIAKQYIESI